MHPAKQERQFVPSFFALPTITPGSKVEFTLILSSLRSIWGNNVISACGARQWSQVVFSSLETNWPGSFLKRFDIKLKHNLISKRA